eukprot:10914070-Lingulodinium_polyedra.AAC.1
MPPGSSCSSPWSSPAPGSPCSSPWSSPAPGYREVVRESPEHGEEQKLAPYSSVMQGLLDMGEPSGALDLRALASKQGRSLQAVPDLFHVLLREGVAGHL